MSDIIERHRDLSRRVLSPNETRPAAKQAATRTSGQPMHPAQACAMGTIVGLAIFVVIWIVSGYSRTALAMPFLGGVIGAGIGVMRRGNKTP